jgi:hypothetical protein
VVLSLKDKEKKKKDKPGRMERAGKSVGGGMKKGWDVAKRSGRGLKKGLFKKRGEEEEEEEESEEE